MAFGLAGMALSLCLSALAWNPLTFGLAFALYSPASGIACGIAQAALMDLDPQHREQRMTDWAVAGTVGDLVTPIALWVVQALGFGWRAAFFLGACVVSVEVLLFLKLRLPATSASDESEDTD